MSIRYLLWVFVAALAFFGLYLIFTGSTPPSVPVANSVPQSNAIPANVTIIPASLTKDGVPAKLGALTLTQSQTGAYALAEFAQLHGKGFDLSGGYRADYAEGNGKATLWVGQAKDASSAQAMLDAMAQKIGPSNAMFQNLQSLDISGRTLYEADGQGQKHFFYAVNDKIVWLAADPAQAASVLHSLWSAVK
ncbi:MAG: hypothetical protein HZB51_30155 [Chloroflexi bacterium]|nr:hypothetical protein [Chloroflexota bacterium]